MIYLHIGAQKTGSTTLQQIMYSESSLLKDQGFIYARTVDGDENVVSHYNSVRGFFSNCESEIANTNIFLDQFSDSRAKYIISAENLSNWPAQSDGKSFSKWEYKENKAGIVAKISESLSNHEVKIIYCVRNRKDYLKSLFKQHLKVNYEVSRSIDQSLHMFLRRELPRSDFTLEESIWRTYFEDVETIDYDAFRSEGLVEAFFDIIGCQYIDWSRSSNLNISPTWMDLERRRIKNSYGTNLTIEDKEKSKAFNESVEKYVDNVIMSNLKEE